MTRNPKRPAPSPTRARTADPSHDRWVKETLPKSLEKMPERRKSFVTTSGHVVERLARPDAAAEPPERIGYPGEFPYTRGIYPTMYRSRLWTMRQFAGFGTAEETNARFKYLLEHGQTGLSTAFDLPTLMGYDSDHDYSRGEVGREGVAVCSLADMEVLFDQIPLDRVSVSMTINSPAAPIFAMFLGVAEKQGVAFSKLNGTLQNDILKEYIAQKEYVFPPAPSMRLVVDSIDYCMREVPRWNTISISGYHIREAGSTAIQELAFTLADGLAYAEAAVERGIDIDAFAPRLSFFFNAHNDLFEEVAKYRAARRIWARKMRDEFGAKNPASWLLRTHAQTAGCSLTAQQPEVNIVRTTLQALAAVLGGTQSLHTNSMDEALALPTEKSVRIALRTQQVLAHESGVANVVDPLGGSWYVEQLTDQMEQGALDYFRRIDELGGVIPAIEAGFFQREIAEAAYRYQKEIETRDRVIVGVNDFELEEPPIEILKIDPALEKKQLERLSALKAQRDAGVVSRELGRLREAATGTANVFPHLLACARAYATLGEMMDVFREVYGEYTEEATF
ncbi:MAG: methylmalonyl-CoA mutase family protein [Candidatus Wallbacteria bacterium]|nr:methylmalonyl-CoA mutase family protein [Candidatus Wallbacteria bacterium]